MKIKNILIPALLSAVLIVPGISSAQTMSSVSLQTQITALLQQVAALQAQLNSKAAQKTPVACHTFLVNLKIGAAGGEVAALQAALGADGETVPTTGFFGSLTAAAVTKFQEKYTADILAPNGLASGTGTVGASTRAKLNLLHGCTAVVPPNPQNPALSGTPPTQTPTPPFTPIPGTNPAPVPINPLPATTPAPSLTSPLGGSSHVKSSIDRLGTINFSISSAGSIALNKITVTFSGNAVSPDLIANASLEGPNGVNVVASGATMSTSTNSATWTFGTGPAGFALSAGSKDSFTLKVDSTKAAAAQAGVAQSLSASIQSQNDILFTDGLDAVATVNIGLASSQVPATINSVSYPVGQ